MTSCLKALQLLLGLGPSRDAAANKLMVAVTLERLVSDKSSGLEYGCLGHTTDPECTVGGTCQ